MQSARINSLCILRIQTNKWSSPCPVNILSIPLASSHGCSRTVLVPPAGTNLFPSPVLQMTILEVGPYHRLVPLTHLNPRRPRIRGPNQGLIRLPSTHRRRLAIVVTGNPRTGRTAVVFLAWLGAFCIPSEAATKTLVRSLLVPTQGPGPCLGVGNLVPALAPSRGTGRLARGVNLIAPWIGYIPTLDRDAPKQRLSTIDRMSHTIITQVPTPVILTEIPLTSGPHTTAEATDGTLMIARGKDTRIETARGGTPTPGRTRNSIERGVDSPYFALDFNMHLSPYVLRCSRPRTSTCRCNNKL